MERRAVSAVSAMMLTLLLIGMLTLAFNISDVGSSSSWVWVRDTVTGDYGEAVVGTGTDIYIARGNSFYRYRPSDNSFVELAAPPQPDGYAFKTGAALAWEPPASGIWALYGAATGESRRYFYRYDIAGDFWDRMPDTPVDQGEGDTITFVDFPIPGLFATIGGEQRPTYLMFYDIIPNQWVHDDSPLGPLADPPAGMGGMHCAASFLKPNPFTISGATAFSIIHGLPWLIFPPGLTAVGPVA